MKLPFLNFYCHWGIFPDYSIIYNILITTQFVNSISISNQNQTVEMKRGKPGHVTSQKEEIQPGSQDRYYLGCGFPYLHLSSIQYRVISYV